MTTIILHTAIQSDLQSVFDRSIDIDFHSISASQTQEKAIAGTTTGLIGLNETVTWRGKHFGVFLTHTSKIIAFERSNSFTDIMIKGHFKYFRHDHYFEEKNGSVVAKDVLTYDIPYGILGQWFDRQFLKKHLTQFLKTRNLAIKNSLEGQTHY